jgi:hypothetical protein
MGALVLLASTVMAAVWALALTVNAPATRIANEELRCFIREERYHILQPFSIVHLLESSISEPANMRCDRKRIHAPR